MNYNEKHYKSQDPFTHAINDFIVFLCTHTKEKAVIAEVWDDLKFQKKGEKKNNFEVCRKFVDRWGKKGKNIEKKKTLDSNEYKFCVNGTRKVFLVKQHERAFNFQHFLFFEWTEINFQKIKFEIITCGMIQ